MKLIKLNTDTYYDTDVPLKLYAESKKTDTKVTYFMFPFIGHIQFKQIHREKRKQIRHQGIKNEEVGNDYLADVNCFPRVMKTF